MLWKNKSIIIHHLKSYRKHDLRVLINVLKCELCEDEIKKLKTYCIKLFSKALNTGKIPFWNHFKVH